MTATATIITCILPLRIESTANKREHWRTKARRAASHRQTAWLLLHNERRTFKSYPSLIDTQLPCVVTLTRIAPRELDTDNLAAGFKACRDGVAEWLGVDDGDERIRWRYAQEKGKPKTYLARVEVAMP